MAKTQRDLIYSVECDFSKVSRRWGIRWAQIENDAPILMGVIYSDAQDDLSPKELHKLELGRIEAREKLNQLIDERQKLMSQVVTKVPREWLVADAPDDIDWSDPSSLLDYVREDMSSNLMIGVSVARNESVKNSLTLIPSNGDTPAQMSSSPKKSMSE